MSIFELYLLTRLDAIHTFCIVCIVLGFCVSAGLFMFGVMTRSTAFSHDDKDYKDGSNLIRHAKKAALYTLIVGIVGLFVPTTKEVAVIYGLNYVTNNEEAKQLPDNILKVVNKQLEEWNEEK